MPRLLPGTKVEFVVVKENGDVEMGSVKGADASLPLLTMKAVSRALKKLEPPKAEAASG
jgi:hypothetical protein